MAVATALVRGAPHLAVLLVRALRDPRVSMGTKSRILATGLYVFSPIDLVPELLFSVVGYGDDALVVVALLDRLLNHEPRQVVAELWTGRPDDLATLQACLGRWGGWVNRRLRPAVAWLVSRLFLGSRAPLGGRHEPV